VKTAKRTAWGALALTVTALAVPTSSANADPGDTLKGGCGFDTNQNAILTRGANQGVIYVTALSQEASGTPSTATVTCWIDVNGVEQPGTRLSSTGNGVIAGLAEISFSSVTGDNITECQRVTFDDGSTWTAKDGNVGVDCPEPGDLINTVTELPDFAVCPFLIATATVTGGGVLGVLWFGPDGDIYIADPTGIVYAEIYDCPPY
jgi:hypothetical protein